MRLFWAQGFTATSLDDLSTATGMTRPSLYNAFGNKKALYRRALARFAERMRAEAGIELERHTQIGNALLAYYEATLAVYCDAPAPQGCLFFCTAVAEAAAHADIRDDLQAVIGDLDDVFERRLRRAIDAGQLPAATDPAALAALVQAVQHSLSIRARAGTPRVRLHQFLRESVHTLLAPG